MRNRLESSGQPALERARKILSLYEADRVMALNTCLQKYRPGRAGRTLRYFVGAADGAPRVPVGGEMGDALTKEILVKGRQAAMMAAKWIPPAVLGLAPAAGPRGVALGMAIGGVLGDAADFILPSDQLTGTAATLWQHNVDDLSRPGQRAMTPAEVYFVNNAFDASDDARKYAAVLPELNKGVFAGSASMNPMVFMTHMYQNELRRKTAVSDLKRAAAEQGNQLSLAIALQIEGNQNQAEVLNLMNAEVVPMLKTATAEIKVAADFARAEKNRQDTAVRRDQYTDPLNSLAASRCSRATTKWPSKQRVSPRSPARRLISRA